MTNPYAWIQRSLDTIHRANWHRSVTTVTGRPGAVITLEGQQLVNFASNDYLGLAGDERLIQAAIAATKAYGTGCTGSRLISGHRELHHQLEQAIAALKQTEAAIVFSSGYLANLGAIAALVGNRDLILSDQYNHSSLKNGAILSGATVLNYAHCNTNDLQTLLSQHRKSYRRCLILTDSVFSMDGDLCPLPEILRLAETFECMVLVDEAHGTGVFGKTGAGCVEHLGCTGRPLIQMGTLSKALGSLGGYVAGSAPLIDFLRNRAASWIYTTALSPADTAAALEAIRIVQREPERRAQLWRNVNWLKQSLLETFSHSPSTWCPSPVACRLLPSHSPILCLQVDSPATVLQIGHHLQKSGFFVSAVRPPTVPTSRLRITVMATHECTHLRQFTTVLGNIFRQSNKV
ncbi:8-amino-7-oxononanoate synthase [Leptolyngbyaceae cyanobacterium JSC-12]|nr:8-amino-7-oxononanoate synthase [Leptolyngbyaceae cyanobacterium JSC-12]